MAGYGRFAQYYDALTRNVPYEGRAAYFDQLIRKHCPAAQLLLDLACGTGSLSVALASRGYEVIGADASGEMLSVAMQKAVEAGEEILFLRQPMERLDLYGTVDACVCALDSLNHLPGPAALDRALARLQLFVRPGGVFAFDLNTLYKHREVLGNNTFVYDLPEVYCVWQNSFHPLDGRVDISLDFFAPDDDTGGCHRESEAFSEWVFSQEELELLLNQHQFRLLAVHGEDSFQPPGPDSQRLVYLAIRED